LQTHRLQDNETPTYFGLPRIDRLLHAVAEARPTSIKPRPTSPVVELTSLAPGGGKTHVLYHLTALAVLPISHGGKQACAIIIETDDSFSVQRLGQQLSILLNRSRHTKLSENELNDSIFLCLKHVHVFRPQSLPSTIVTLDSLPTYLFDKTRHHSFDRPVGFIALESASAFYWQHRADEEDAALLATTTPANNAPSKPSGYAQLGAALKAASATFSCPVVFTSWHLGPAPTSTHSGNPEARSLRTSIPAPLSQLPTLRLIVQRVPVRKLPSGISVEEALREASDRQKAVEEGKFEAMVNEWGLDERTLQKLQRQGAGFSFRITDDGVLFESSQT